VNTAPHGQRFTLWQGVPRRCGGAVACPHDGGGVPA